MSKCKHCWHGVTTRDKKHGDKVNYEKYAAISMMDTDRHFKACCHCGMEEDASL